MCFVFWLHVGVEGRGSAEMCNAPSLRFLIWVTVWMVMPLTAQGTSRRGRGVLGEGRDISYELAELEILVIRPTEVGPRAEFILQGRAERGECAD